MCLSLPAICFQVEPSALSSKISSLEFTPQTDPSAPAPISVSPPGMFIQVFSTQTSGSTTGTTTGATTGSGHSEGSDLHYQIPSPELVPHTLSPCPTEILLKAPGI